jgi:co-chaperonin GroES (HSP10)
VTPYLRIRRHHALSCGRESISQPARSLQEDGSVQALDIKVGERVLFARYAGQTVRVEGEELLVMREQDIVGIIE